jgi:hypothetical protein
LVGVANNNRPIYIHYINKYLCSLVRPLATDRSVTAQWPRPCRFCASEAIITPGAGGLRSEWWRLASIPIPGALNSSYYYSRSTHSFLFLLHGAMRHTVCQPGQLHAGWLVALLVRFLALAGGVLAPRQPAAPPQPRRRPGITSRWPGAAAGAASGAAGASLLPGADGADERRHLRDHARYQHMQPPRSKAHQARRDDDAASCVGPSRAAGSSSSGSSR